MIYDITPVPKPRMTRGDKFQKRPRGAAYRTFKQECQLKRVKVPECNYHVIFHIPMPKSWSKKKRDEMNGKPHQQAPDKDNLEKALLDAVFEDDSRVWDGRATKVWSETGSIEIREIEDD